MNERIKELAEQAWHDLPAHWWERKDGSVAEAVNKFAELIVRECISIASQEDFDVMMKEGYPCSQTAKKIQEHFGVE